MGNGRFGRFSRCGGGLFKIEPVCVDLQAPIEDGPGSHGNAIKSEAFGRVSALKSPVVGRAYRRE